ncbi:MAG: hypothetical protein ACP5G7_01470 [Anaerolineae bacterium]
MIKTHLAAVLDDRVAYRNLEPVMPELAGLRATWEQIGLDAYRIPRKTEPAYARVLLSFVQRAQALRGQPPVARLLFIGDTPMNDAQAARNLGELLPLHGFIAADRLTESPSTKVEGRLMRSNRWASLAAWLDWLRDESVAVDERTALLLDIDKTLMGARGRNDHVINAARVAAIEATMRAALGSTYDKGRFEAIYERINQTVFHPFTKDNQDYVAYVCLMLMAGVHDEDRLWQDLESGDLVSFEAFVDRCDGGADGMSEDLATIHHQVLAGLRAGDPTPFKDFRRQEYLETIARMDVASGDTEPELWLEREIVITAEVLNVARWALSQGALTFGLSDKPDEASIPTAEQAARGMLAVHRATMKVFGESVV